MNKTKKRAIQKHRAKELKFEARRKTGAQENPAGTQTSAVTSAPRTKQPARPRQAAAAPAAPVPEVEATAEAAATE